MQLLRTELHAHWDAVNALHVGLKGLLGYQGLPRVLLLEKLLLLSHSSHGAGVID